MRETFYSFRDRYGRMSNIELIGTAAQIKKTKEALSNICITGVEMEDRLAIQKAIDSTGMASVMYAHNSVYPIKLAKELSKMLKSGSIEKMSNEMYRFISTNYDIAHYSKQGFIEYYDGSVIKMLMGIKGDVQRSAYAVSSEYSDRFNILYQSGVWKALGFTDMQVATPLIQLIQVPNDEPAAPKATKKVSNANKKASADQLAKSNEYEQLSFFDVFKKEVVA